jgi:dinuclear metal center YbgI/SA1388 family protein
MKVADVVRVLETLAPRALAEEWDNVGLLVGDRQRRVTKLLVCVDAGEDVLAEALKAGAQMILAHHPVIFKSLARVTAEDSPVVHEAVRSGVAIYAAHTNLDNAAGGTNDVLADALVLGERRAITPLVRRDQCKLAVFTPPEDVSRVADAAFDAGAGQVGNYNRCAFLVHGLGSFCPQPGAKPAVGRTGRQEVVEELRLEVVCPRSKAPAVCEAISAAHSYETPAIDVYPLDDFPPGCGGGRIGTLARPMTVRSIVGRLKKATGAPHVQVAAPAGPGSPRVADKAGGQGRLVRRAAVFAGAGGSAWAAAAAAGATLYVTGEMGHHDALDAVAIGLTVLCLGHGHSERIGIRALACRAAEMLGDLEVINSAHDRDPYATA